MPNKDGKVCVLSADGGGTRGLITLEVLRRIEEVAGRPCCELFDLIVGTSAGGLIALALSQGMSAASLLAIYRRYCPLIFKRDNLWRLKSLGQLAGPKYDNNALYRCAYEVVGGHRRMGETRAEAMVTTYNIATRTPRFLTSWDTPDVLRLDAAMMTTAAPTYFAPWHDHVDGGVCDNNPALSGVVEACRKWGVSVREVLCLSVGTGSDAKPYSGAEAASWGLLSWAEPLVSLFTDGTSELHAYHLERLMPSRQLLRLQIKVEGEMAALDNADQQNLDHLHAAGMQLVEQALAEGRLPALLGELA